jgi:Fe-S-cluster containining protein
MGIKEDLEFWQKKYLSPYCLKKCEKLCCSRKKTKVLMEENQLREAYGLSLDEKIINNDNHILTETQTGGALVYWVSIHPTKKQPHCPAYEPGTRRCRIEHNKPRMCRDYPLSLENNILRLSSKCDAINKDNPVMERLIEMSRQYSLRTELLKDK